MPRRTLLDKISQWMAVFPLGKTVLGEEESLDGDNAQGDCGFCFPSAFRNVARSLIEHTDDDVLSY